MIVLEKPKIMAPDVMEGSWRSVCIVIIFTKFTL